MNTNTFHIKMHHFLLGQVLKGCRDLQQVVEAQVLRQPPTLCNQLVERAWTERVPSYLPLYITALSQANDKKALAWFVVHEKENIRPVSDNSEELQDARRSEGTPRARLLAVEPLQGDLEGGRRSRKIQARLWIRSVLPFWQQTWTRCWHLERCGLRRRSLPWWTLTRQTPFLPYTLNQRAGCSDEGKRQICD